MPCRPRPPKRHDVLLCPGSRFVVPLCDVIAQLNFDIAKHHFVFEDYETAHRHFLLARKHFQEAQPGLLALHDADKGTGALACGALPSQRFTDFSAATLDGYDRACVGLGVAATTQLQHTTAHAVRAYLQGDNAHITDVVQRSIHGSTPGMSNLVQQIVNREAAAFPTKAWELRVDSTVEGVAKGLVPRPSFWTEFVQRTEDAESMRAVFEACAATLAELSSPASAASSRVGAFARRITTRLQKSSLADSMKQEFPLLVQATGDAAGTAGQQSRPAAAATQLVAEMEAASELAHEQLATPASRELELASTLTPQTMIAILRHPDAGHSNVNGILVPKIRRLRNTGPHGCQHALKLFEHLGNDELLRGASVHMERIFTAISASDNQVATPEMMKQLEADITAVSTDDCTALATMAAHVVNRGDWALATSLGKEWSTRSSSQCREVGQFLGHLASACVALAADRPQADTGDDGMDAQPAEGSQAGNDRLTSAVLPLCRNIADLIVQPPPEASNKRKRDDPGPAGDNTWETILSLIERLTSKTVLKAVVCALTVAYNRAQTQSLRENRLSFSRYGPLAEPFFPIAETLVVHDAGSARTSEVFTAALQDVIRIAHRTDARDDAYTFALADLYFTQGDHLLAARHYFEAFGQVSVFFQQQVPPAYLKEKTIKRLIDCLMNLNAHIQVRCDLCPARLAKWGLCLWVQRPTLAGSCCVG